MTAFSQPIYSIGAVSKILNVPAATLRTWQERYGVVKPTRSPGGHRLYTRDHLAQLRFVADKVAEGLSPGDAHRLLHERLAQGTGVGGATQDRGKLLILLAERDVYAADFAAYFLRTEGYEVAIERDADGALARVTELSPDLIKIDLLISGGRGLELCKKISACTDAPILAISTLGLRDAALEAGASAFLQRPVPPLQLVSTIQDLLGQSAFIHREKATP